MGINGDLHRHLNAPFPEGSGDRVWGHSLLSNVAVRNLRRGIARVTGDGEYVYQMPLEQAPAPISSALGQTLRLFSSNSYLGLGTHPAVTRAAAEALEQYGTTAAGVRLMSGTLELHRSLERTLAGIIGTEAATTFGSGYDANLAAISTFVGRRDLVLHDALAHRSLREGITLSGAKSREFRHNDMSHLESRLAAHRSVRRVLIVVDGVYSMEGDLCPLPQLVELKERWDAHLLVDEAHALGAVGKTGRGTCEVFGVDPGRVDLITGSLSKGIPSGGGFVAASAGLVRSVQHLSGPWVFSSAMTPVNAAAAEAALGQMVIEPERLERLRENSQALRAGVKRLGIPTVEGTSPICPLLLGDRWRAFRWARQLLDLGIQVLPVIPPAVAVGCSRLRLCVTAAHSPGDIAFLLDGLAACLEAETACEKP